MRQAVSSAQARISTCSHHLHCCRCQCSRCRDYPPRPAAVWQQAECRERLWEIKATFRAFRDTFHFLQLRLRDLVVLARAFSPPEFQIRDPPPRLRRRTRPIGSGSAWGCLSLSRLQAKMPSRLQKSRIPKAAVARQATQEAEIETPWLSPVTSNTSRSCQEQTCVRSMGRLPPTCHCHCSYSFLWF